MKNAGIFYVEKDLESLSVLPKKNARKRVGSKGIPFERLIKALKTQNIATLVLRFFF